MPDFLASESWSGGFVAGLPAKLHRIAVRQGVMLLASEKELVWLRAGEEHPRTRPLPDGVAPVLAVAVERRRNPRLAVGGPRGVVVLDGQKIATLRGKAPLSPIENVAWGPHPSGGTALYLMTEEGGLDRARPGTRDFEEVPLGYLVAMAAGEDGSIAVASIDPEAPAVWTTRNGETWHYRILDELDATGDWSLAVSGDAVAVRIAWRGVWISRGLDEPFARCEALGGGGALTFAGDGADAPLLCAVHEGLTENIMRVEASGAVARIVSMDPPAGGEEPHVASLAWDSSRGVLWGLMHEGGLLRVEPRRPDGGSKLLS